jgi:hypothetical protein
MMNAETPSEYVTIAEPTVVGGILKLATIPPIDTGKADALKEIRAWPKAITIIGVQEALSSARALAEATD